MCYNISVRVIVIKESIVTTRKTESKKDCNSTVSVDTEYYHSSHLAIPFYKLEGVSHVILLWTVLHLRVIYEESSFLLRVRLNNFVFTERYNKQNPGSTVYFKSFFFWRVTFFTPPTSTENNPSLLFTTVNRKIAIKVIYKRSFYD